MDSNAFKQSFLSRIERVLIGEALKDRLVKASTIKCIQPSNLISMKVTASLFAAKASTQIDINADDYVIVKVHKSLLH